MLDFERWWGGFYRLSGEEIVAIIEDLFVGNKIERGQVRIDEHCVADLKRIRNPLIIFASYCDNITPPHQALGWLPVVYASTDELKRAGQSIVYLTNPEADTNDGLHRIHGAASSNVRTVYGLLSEARTHLIGPDGRSDLMPSVGRMTRSAGSRS